MLIYLEPDLDRRCRRSTGLLVAVAAVCGEAEGAREIKLGRMGRLGIGNLRVVSGIFTIRNEVLYAESVGNKRLNQKGTTSTKLQAEPKLNPHWCRGKAFAYSSCPQLTCFCQRHKP